MKINNNQINEIRQILGDSNSKLYENEDMSKHCSMRVGNRASLFIVPDNREDLKKILEYVSKNTIPYYVLGRGSNCIFADPIYEGVVLNIDKAFSSYKVEENQVIVGAGMPIALLSRYARDNGLSGLEFASGIPGSTGGAVYMNAGCFGGEIKNVVSEVECLDRFGQVTIFKKDDMDLSYRHSMFKDNKQYIILTVKFVLETKSKEEIAAIMGEINKKRLETQPHRFPSCGSTFKRGKDYITAKLIDEAGLKGYKMGNAQVSSKHAGFIENAGNATTEEILELIEYVKRKVKEKFDKDIEEEIEIVRNKGE